MILSLAEKLCLLLLVILLVPARGQDTGQLNVALRTQRDLANFIPRDRAAGTGLLLNTFLQNNYTIEAFNQTEKFLVSLVRRIVIDVHWDNWRKRWQLCPLPYPATNISADLTAGNIVCSATPLTVGDIFKYIKEWFTSRAEYANTVIGLILNLNDLRVSIPPGESAPSKFPAISELLPKNGIFTPAMLETFRRAVANETSPYFITTVNPTDGTLATPNGWPKGQLLVSNGTQLLVGFGRNNLGASSGYDVTRDRRMIFTAAEIAGIPALNTSMLPDELPSCGAPSNNTAMVGTGFDRLDKNFTGNASSTTRNISWSWPYIEDTPSKPFTSASISQLVNCGFRAVFTQNFSVEMLNATIWGWEDKQPSDMQGLDCAVIKRSSGRWAADRCQALMPVACQLLPVNSSRANPYNWTVVPTRKTFPNAAGACPPDYAFSVPKTAQENSALAMAVAESGFVKVWINFNQVVSRCWVQGWQEHCPYDVTDPSYRAFIGATLKQGIVIVLIFGVFLFFKCRRQLRVSRLNRRKAEVRRKIRQADYMTVPA